MKSKGISGNLERFPFVWKTDCFGRKSTRKQSFSLEKISSFFPLKAFLFIRFYLNYRNNTVPFACPNYKHAPLKNTQFVCGVNCIVPFGVKILPGFSALAESILCQMVHILVSLCFVFLYLEKLYCSVTGKILTRFLIQKESAPCWLLERLDLSLLGLLVLSQASAEGLVRP